MSNYFRTLDVFATLQEACAAVEIQVPRVIKSGWIRVPTLAERRGGTSGAVREFDDVPGGFVCMNWQKGWQAVTFPDYGKGKKLSKKEKKELEAKLDEMRERDRRALALVWEHAAAVAAEIVRCAVTTPSTGIHPYLAAKKLGEYAPYLPTIDKATAQSLLTAGGIDQSLERLSGRLLVVPLYRAGWVPASVSFIDETGRKCLLKGGQKQGSFWGSPALLQSAKRGGVLGMAEGVATGLAVMALYAVPCAVGIDAGNLKAASQTVLKQFPGCRIRFFADVDASKTGENAAYAAWLSLPEWARSYLPGEKAEDSRRPGVVVPPFNDADKKLWGDLQTYQRQGKALSDFADYWLLHQGRRL